MSSSFWTSSVKGSAGRFAKSWRSRKELRTCAGRRLTRGTLSRLDTVTLRSSAQRLVSLKVLSSHTSQLSFLVVVTELVNTFPTANSTFKISTGNTSKKDLNDFLHRNGETQRAYHLRQNMSNKQGRNNVIRSLKHSDLKLESHTHHISITAGNQCNDHYLEKWLVNQTLVC